MKDIIDILSVDDQPVNLLLIEEILHPLDIHIISCPSGEQALELCDQHTFHLFILDVMMPGMDGFELARVLRDRDDTGNVPILFITALGTEKHHVLQGYEAGGVDYLIKPLEPEILRSKVRTFIELHRKNVALEKAAQKQERMLERLKRSRDALATSEERYRIIADYAYHWENWIGPDDQMQYVSMSCERIAGYPPETFMESPAFIESILHDEDVHLFRDCLAEAETHGSATSDFRFFRSDEDMRWLGMVCNKVVDRQGKSLGLRYTLSDITERKRLELQLRHQALHDPLTGLSNRTLCQDRIRAAIDRARRRDEYHYAVVFMDMDRFKIINDSLGHSAGDKLLMQLAERLRACLRDLDTVARFGGDEFVLVLEELAAERDAIRTVRRIRESLQDPFLIEGHDVIVTASFGIALGTDEYTEPTELLRNADIALQWSKERGKNRLKVFNNKMLTQAIRLLTIEGDLRKHIGGEHFYLMYQPILALDSSCLVGFEALVRWNHPEKGEIGPVEFIPIAEDTGLITELGMWVLEDACLTMADWCHRIPKAANLLLSVNISGKQFKQPTIVEQIRKALARTDVDPAHLKLEITESAIMDHAEVAIDKLNQLKNLGIKLSVDDFGTGYSSMSYLQQFPIDHLKIDLSFVRQMTESEESLEIVKGIISLAHGLKLKVIAEGVETEEQRDTLRTLNCEYGQGYLYSRPMPKEQAEAFILGAMMDTCQTDLPGCTLKD